MNPKVSINLCCYNSEKYLKETLDSIVNQTYKDWELVIINDGSTDSTEAIVKEYIEKGYPIVYHYQKNHGLGYSRNEALKRSSGEFIAFIDHDDMWLPYKLEKQVEILKGDNDVDFVYSNYYCLKDGKQKVCFKRFNPEGNVFKKFLRQYPVALLTVMLNKSAIDRLGSLFDTNLKLSEEYELFMRILYHARVRYIHEPLAIYRLHPQMGSLKYIDRWPDEMDYILNKLRNIYPYFEKDCFDEIEYMKAKIGYYKARAMMVKSKRHAARALLKPYISLDYRFFFLYLMTYFPSSLWHYVHKVMTNGAFSMMG